MKLDNKKNLYSVVAIVIILTFIISYIAMKYQGDTIINDMTKSSVISAEAARSVERSDTPEAKLSQNAVFYTDELAAKFNASIDTITVSDTTDGVKITLKNSIGEIVNDLSEGKIFMLEGDENTPFKSTYITKVVSIEKTDEHIVILTENPAIDEVFNELDINIEESVSVNDIKSYYLADGVTLKVADNRMDNKSDIKKALEGSTQENMELDFKVDLKNLVDINGIVKEDELVTASLEGRLKLDNLKVNMDINYDITTGFNQLIYGVSGDTDVNVDLSLELSDKIIKDKMITSDISSYVKMACLEDKMIPIAFLDIKTNDSIKVTHSNGMIQTNSTCPVSIGAILYVDLEGNATISTDLTLKHNNKFSSKAEFVKDGKWVNEFTSDCNEDYEVSARIDSNMDSNINIGNSVSVYLANINAFDFAITEFGTNLRGKVKYSKDEYDIDFEGHAKGYLRFGNIKTDYATRLAVTEENDENKAESFKYLTNRTMKDELLFESGEENKNIYDKNEMSYSRITATDEEFIYYKDTKGKLIRESKANNLKITLMETEFVNICGIDKMYIYYTVNDKAKRGYDVYRINKTNLESEEVVSDVKLVLLQDRTNMYYVPYDDLNSIYKYDRFSMDKSKFATFNYKVQIMTQKADEFLVVTLEDSVWSVFINATNHYYQLDSKGNITKDFVDGMGVWDYSIEQYDNYYSISKKVSSGYLRNTASDVYWGSLDKKKTIKTESKSGWSSKEEGIVTTSSIKGDKEYSYKMFLYQAADGAKTEVTKVKSAQAIFTLTKSDSGYWYYLDQTDEAIIICKLAPDFKEKTIVKEIPLSEANCNLEDCAVENTDGRLYFYTMPYEQSCTVLYRYELR